MNNNSWFWSDGPLVATTAILAACIVGLIVILVYAVILIRRDGKSPMVLLLLLILPVLAHAQTSAPQVGKCIAGAYEECRLVAGHWYYKQHGEWTRDDGVKGAPPVVPVATCPATTLSREAVNAALQSSIADRGHSGDTSTSQRAISSHLGAKFDRSFIRDPRFISGVSFSFGVTTYDINTSHGLEATRFYRNDAGMLNKGKYVLITTLTNVAVIPLDANPNHKWRWFTLAVRVGTASWRLRSALQNGGHR